MQEDPNPKQTGCRTILLPNNVCLNQEHSIGGKQTSQSKGFPCISAYLSYLLHQSYSGNGATWTLKQFICFQAKDPAPTWGNNKGCCSELERSWNLVDTSIQEEEELHCRAVSRLRSQENTVAIAAQVTQPWGSSLPRTNESPPCVPNCVTVGFQYPKDTWQRNPRNTASW